MPRGSRVRNLFFFRRPHILLLLAIREFISSRRPQIYFLSPSVHLFYLVFRAFIFLLPSADLFFSRRPHILFLLAIREFIFLLPSANLFFSRRPHIFLLSPFTSFILSRLPRIYFSLAVRKFIFTSCCRLLRAQILFYFLLLAVT